MSPTMRRAALALAVAVHLAVLYTPRVPTTGAEGVPGADKVVHAAVFAAVVLAGALAHLPLRPLVAALLAHAVLSEVVQHVLLPHRSGDGADVAADVLGVLGGWLLARRLSPARDHDGPAPSGPGR